MNSFDTTHFLDSLSIKLLSLNPTLLSTPPSIIEQTNGNDICYQRPTIYCEELALGARGMVGSWFISPRQIIVETVAVLLVSMSILYWVRPCIPIPSDPTSLLRRPPIFMRIGTALVFTLQILYKLFGYPGKLLVMVMPCNVLWILNMILSFYYNNRDNGNGNSSSKISLSYHKIAYTILQLQCSYVVLVFVALSNPDFSDTVLFGEMCFFFLHHFFLLYYIIHYIFVTRQLSTLAIDDSNHHENSNNKNNNNNNSISISIRTAIQLMKNIVQFMKWILISSSYFAIFYFAIVTPMGVLSGLNLNYMLHPPPNQNDLVGQTYRITSIGYCTVSFTIMRFMIVMLEFIWKKICAGISGTRLKIE